MLHRLRSVLVRPDREPLAGVVEVDETFIGGLEPGRGAGQEGPDGDRGGDQHVPWAGPDRMAPVPDGSAASLHGFIVENVAPGARVVTDAWNGYQGLEALGYVRERRSQRAARAAGEDPNELLPGGAPGRLVAQALAAGYSAGLGRARASAGLP